MPVEVTIKTDKNGRRHIVGRIKPGRYATVDDYSGGQRKNISIHVAPNNSVASIYEFPNGSYTSFRRPGYRYIPLKLYSRGNLARTIRPGQHFEYPFTTKSAAHGRLVFSHLPSHRGARTSLMGRHK